MSRPSMSFGFKRPPKKATARTPLTGNDFLNHWENLDRSSNDNTAKLQAVRTLAEQGLVPHRVYQDLVRVNAEKNTGSSRKQQPMSKWQEKPTLEGYLYFHLTTTSAKPKKQKWRRFYCSLTRAELTWRKKKASKDLIGTVNFNAVSTVKELLPQRTSRLPSTNSAATQTNNALPRKTSAASENGVKMRHAFEIETAGKKYQFAAESAELKKYWVFTLKLTFKRIADRLKMEDEPVLMTSRPKLSSFDGMDARKIREHNYRESLAGGSSGKWVKDNVRGSQRTQYTLSRTIEPHKGSFEEQAVQRNSTVASENESNNEKKVVRIQYVHKDSIRNHLHSNTDSTPPPLLDLDGEVAVSPKLSKNRSLPKIPSRAKNDTKRNNQGADKTSQSTETNLDTLSDEYSPLDVDTPPDSELIGQLHQQLGLKARSSSFASNVAIQVTNLRALIAEEEQRVMTAEKSLETLTKQVQVLRKKYEQTKHSPDASQAEIDASKAALNKVRHAEVTQESQLAKASARKEQLKEEIKGENAELIKADISKRILHEMQNSKPNAPNQTKLAVAAAEKVLEKALKEERRLSKKIKEVQNIVTKLKQEEDEMRDNEKVARKLKRQAMTKSIEKSAGALLAKAVDGLRAAEDKLWEKESEWADLVTKSMEARIRSFEVKKVLNERRRNQIANKQAPPLKSRSQTTPVTKSMNNTKPGKPNNKLGNFIKSATLHAQAEEAAPPPLPPLPPKQTFEKTVSRFAAFTGIERLESDNVEEVDEHGPEQYQYEDFTESYYSDENYPRLEELEFLDSRSYQNGEYGEATMSSQNPAFGGKAALQKQAEITEDIKELCKIMEEHGRLNDDGNWTSTLTELNNVYEDLGKGVEMVLFGAKEDGFVDYEGDSLSLEEGGLVITLLLKEY